MEKKKTKRSKAKTTFSYRINCIISSRLLFNISLRTKTRYIHFSRNYICLTEIQAKEAISSKSQCCWIKRKIFDQYDQTLRGFSLVHTDESFVSLSLQKTIRFHCDITEYARVHKWLHNFSYIYVFFTISHHCSHYMTNGFDDVVVVTCYCCKPTP